MAIRVALSHETIYRYDRAIALGPQIVRLRPAPHCRTPILGYGLRIAPAAHVLHWLQDPQGNFLARVVIAERTREFRIAVDLTAEMAALNPFDFFLDPGAEQVPFRYEAGLAKELGLYLETEAPGPRLRAWLDSVARTPTPTVGFLVSLNQRLEREIGYIKRMEPGIQPCDETLALARGSCRDTGWLLVQILRHLGLAARFVSGYLIQLVPDGAPPGGPPGGPPGPDTDVADLHAWAEAYLPGAGWVGLDPTSGFLAGEGHIPLACAHSPAAAAPVTGTAEPAEVEFSYAIEVERTP